ncbi:hypothetical protein GN156_25475, partial [bacterium LRH843]|nr:hypothetical protein [bacterium LRH843]
MNQGDKKASWDHNVELACSLEEINDSFGGCISAIASRIAFASGDDEEMFEYMKEQSVSSLQSELHDVDGVGLVDAVKSLNLSSSAPKNGISEPR